MQTIRRLYLYAVTFISLETVLWGAIRLARSFLNGEDTTALASALALILVGGPVFLVHWFLVQRSAVRALEERSARLRAVFLYGTLLATLVPVVQNVLALVNRAWLAVFGLDPSLAVFGGDQIWSHNVVAILVNSLGAVFILAVLRADWKAFQPGPGSEENTFQSGESLLETRQLYMILWLVYSLALAVAGAQQALEALLGLLGGPGSAIQPQLANGLALITTGAPLWVFVDRRLRGEWARQAGDQSTLWQAVLYALTLIGVIGVLYTVGLVLEAVFRLALGEPFQAARFLGQIARPVSIALTMGALGAYYGHALRAEIRGWPEAAHPESPTIPVRGLSVGRRAELRRLVFYSLALIGLAAAFAGLQKLLGIAVDLALSGSLSLSEPVREDLAASLAALIVGLPVWVLAWRPLAVEAALDGELGDHARRSLVRKGYLFLILFAGVLGVMFGAGMLLFQVLSALFDEPSAGLLRESAQGLKTLLLFAVLLVYHWQALRADGRLSGRSLARRHAQFPVLVLAPENGDFAYQMVTALQNAAADLPVAIHSYSQGVPDETLSAAKAVILPAELVARPSEALRLWLQGFAGVRLVVPSPIRDWHWISGSSRSLPALARQTAGMVRRLAEGEELDAPGGISPGLVLVYILAGLAALQILLGIVGVVISLFFR